MKGISYNRIRTTTVHKTTDISSRGIVRIIALVICYLVGGISCGQIKFDVKLSEKHLKKVEQSKDARAKLEAYKDFYKKDSIKAAKKAWKSYRHKHRDSLKSVGKWKEARKHQKEILLGKWKKGNKKKLIFDVSGFKAPEDSLDWALQTLAEEGDYKQLQQIYESYGQYDSAFLDHFHPDSILLDTVDLVERFGLKKQVESYLPKELKLQSDKKIEDQLMFNTLDQHGNLKKVDRSGVKKFFKNVDPNEFSKSQLTMKSAKEKFTELPSLEKREEGIKRKSLQGTPMKKRFFLNGNITIQSTDPVILDNNLQIGYQWNKSLSTGMGMILREQLSSRDSASITGDAHGASFFVNYDIMKGFFLYGEYRIVKNKSLFHESRKPKSWQYAVLLGAGRKFKITKKVALSVLLVYDLNHKNNTLNQRPFYPRIGYSVGF
ncbi:hypothetical protein SAMN05421640_1194 [Ekhidna lutea]|uniref:Outer membrane protein beta-barrel domain-containing protein n=1 Tax=Ekhidna lutea TaxID=447679 RepID=A0A239H9G3_EKHLU|nr:hypothetical protein [Ekhidna lutea]SNS77688.1 hypothetical protein SAMN05421640_1194 [Ekhidna lutea]